MTLNALRIKIKKLQSLLSEFSQMDALIKAMDRNHEKGLEVPQEYYDGAKKRRDAIKAKLEEKLANV